MNPTMQMLLGFLMGEIFKAEESEHEKKLTRIVDDNDTLLGYQNLGVNYLGDNYGRSGLVVRDCPALCLPLVPRMSALLKFKKLVDFDRQMIHQALVKLLQPCQTLQDARDALPEVLVSMHTFLPTLARTRPEAWSIQHTNPRDLRHYQKALPKIEMYCAMKLIY